MTTTITTPSAIEDSTYALVLSFTDEEGDPVTPDTATWTLRDTEGNVVNSRQDVVISSLASSVTVLLSGDDLMYTPSAELILIVEATYDSSLGNDLPLKDQVRFPVANLTTRLQR